VIRSLHSFPLQKLALDVKELTDDAIECLLSQSTLSDLHLRDLSPKQVQLFADALPSLSSLQCFAFYTAHYTRCDYESSFLSLFAALSLSSLRSLHLLFSTFRAPALEACLAEVPSSKLTNLKLTCPQVLTEDCDVTTFDDCKPEDEKFLVDLKTFPFDWSLRFPLLKDRYCAIICDTEW
jgi:hypothetical protein